MDFQWGSSIYSIAEARGLVPNQEVTTVKIFNPGSVDKGVYRGTHCDTLELPQWDFFFSLLEVGGGLLKGERWVWQSYMMRNSQWANKKLLKSHIKQLKHNNLYLIFHISSYNPQQHVCIECPLVMLKTLQWLPTLFKTQDKLVTLAEFYPCDKCPIPGIWSYHSSSSSSRRVSNNSLPARF